MRVSIQDEHISGSSKSYNMEDFAALPSDEERLKFLIPLLIEAFTDFRDKQEPQYGTYPQVDVSKAPIIYIDSKDQFESINLGGERNKI